VLLPGKYLKDSFGTLLFVSPELLLDHPYDHQIDIWSFGIILYNIFTG